MRIQPFSALKETDLQIDVSTPAGKALLAVFRNLFVQLNPFLTAISQLAAKGITLTDNIQGEIVAGAFSHGVPQLVKLKTLTRVAGAVALGALGQVATGVTVAMVQPAAGRASQPLANVTVYFLNPAAVNVQASVLLTPEGQQSG